MILGSKNGGETKMKITEGWKTTLVPDFLKSLLSKLLVRLSFFKYSFYFKHRWKRNFVLQWKSTFLSLTAKMYNPIHCMWDANGPGRTLNIKNCRKLIFLTTKHVLWNYFHSNFSHLSPKWEKWVFRYTAWNFFTEEKKGNRMCCLKENSLATNCWL